MVSVYAAELLPAADSGDIAGALVVHAPRRWAGSLECASVMLDVVETVDGCVAVVKATLADGHDFAVAKAFVNPASPVGRSCLAALHARRLALVLRDDGELAGMEVLRLREALRTYSDAVVAACSRSAPGRFERAADAAATL